MTKATIHRPEYVAAYFHNLSDGELIAGRIVPLADVFEVMSKTKRNPDRVLTQANVVDAEIYQTGNGKEWRKVSGAWVSVIGERGNLKLQCGNSKPFYVASEGEL